MKKGEVITPFRLAREADTIDVLIESDGHLINHTYVRTTGPPGISPSPNSTIKYVYYQEKLYMVESPYKE